MNSSEWICRKCGQHQTTEVDKCRSCGTSRDSPKPKHETPENSKTSPDKKIVGGILCFVSAGSGTLDGQLEETVSSGS